MSQEQIQIPNEATCPNCGIKANGQRTVYDLFGIRMLKDSLEPQSHCKKCRALVLKGKFKDEYNSFKEGMKVFLHEETQKILDEFKPKLIECRERHKKALALEWNDLHEKQSKLKKSVQDMVDKKIDRKKEQLFQAMGKTA